MKFAIPTLALALAASTNAQFYNQSAPFHLILLSSNTTINGSTLSACHEGAAIEGLCLSNSISISQPESIAPGTFTFNYSDSVVTPNVTLGSPGYLTYLLQGSNFNFSEPMGLYVNPTTNVALPLFYPGDNLATVVSFDESNLMNIQGYIDDTKSPAAVGNITAYYRWYSCTTYYTGYTYVMLSWVLGAREPQNPTCIKVNVKRVFT
ncbi:uncharacterized protein BDR25DRAFT_239524 [Lindgomyces ingoldianus]|uniref:Uncharacterized protein n=1 Tax=Lindgomyces ingoldianus TaxID=673940 RepID=A0ACB6QEL3_9PLEO|nr:uncharacterized protein BDR25DRAFT_239524 [Lindgomyces ingoldianus]KAF2465393.1 hypothetical protein BDR25DRAFT_239524 [Lindgomyces ingoldianus]